MKIKGTRVDYGTDVGKKVDQRSGANKQSSSISDQTNAKVPISGVQNEARESVSQVAPKTRDSGK